MFENKPTQIAGVMYLLFVLLFIVIISLNTQVWLTLFIILIISVPYTLLTIYDIDCVFDGNCNVWGWIKGGLFMLYLLTLIIMSIFIIAQSSSEKSSLE